MSGRFSSENPNIDEVNRAELRNQRVQWKGVLPDLLKFGVEALPIWLRPLPAISVRDRDGKWIECPIGAYIVRLPDGSFTVDLNADEETAVRQDWLDFFVEKARLYDMGSPGGRAKLDGALKDYIKSRPEDERVHLESMIRVARKELFEYYDRAVVPQLVRKVMNMEITDV